MVSKPGKGACKLTSKGDWKTMDNDNTCFTTLQHTLIPLCGTGHLTQWCSTSIQMHCTYQTKQEHVVKSQEFENIREYKYLVFFAESLNMMIMACFHYLKSGLV